MRRHVFLITVFAASLFPPPAACQDSKPSTRPLVSAPPEARFRLPPRRQAVEGPEGSRVFAALGEWCVADPPIEFPLSGAAASDLLSDDPMRRSAGARTLVALFAQLRADFFDGRIRGRRPLSGTGEDEDRATDTWRATADLVLGAAGAEETADVAAWLLADDSDAGPRVGIDALVRSRGRRIDAAILAAMRHTSAHVRSAALAEAAKRGLLSEAGLREALSDRATAVREAAARELGRLGIEASSSRPDGALFPWEREQLHLVEAMLLDPIPDDAARVEITTSRETGRPRFVGESRPVLVFEAWRVTAPDGKVRYLDRTGSKLVISTMAYLGGFPWFLAAERVDVTADDTVAKVDFAASVERLDAGRPVPWGESAHRLFDAARLARIGREDLAGRLAREVFDSADDDRAVLEMIAATVASDLYQHLLVAMVIEPDFAEARRIADHLATPRFRGRYHELGVSLSRDLAQRPDDLRKFRLPTGTEWEAIRRGLPRAGQIAFCADRLCLLNCVSSGNPGDFDFAWDLPLSNALIVRNESATRKSWERTAEDPMNPFIVLRELGLTASEIAALAPRMVDPPAMLSAIYYKPQITWTLLGVDAALGQLLNEAAGFELFPAREWRRLDPSARRAHVAEVVQWCEAHRHVDPATLRRETEKFRVDERGDGGVLVWRVGGGDGLPSPWRRELSER